MQIYILIYFFRRVLLFSSEYYRRRIAIFTRVKTKCKGWRGGKSRKLFEREQGKTSIIQKVANFEYPAYASKVISFTIGDLILIHVAL